MKKILVAVDISRSSGNDACIETAKDIARMMDGEVVLLHVLEPIPHYVVPSMPGGVLARHLQEAKKAIRDLGERHGCAEVVVREGRPAGEILDYAGRIKADLIILNSHDPGVAEYLLGSVAGRVASRAHCSVYVLRQPAA